MEFSGGIQFGGGIQLTAPPVITVNTIPNSTIAPVVFNAYHPGASNVGQTLTCTTGTWEGTLPITYTYQWRRANTIGGYGTPTGNNNIASATSNTYIIVDGEDVTRQISCTVTATNSAGSASANSNHAWPISYIGHTPWIVSESPEYANWLNNNGIVSFDVSFGRRRIFNSTGAPKSDMSANNQIIINLPISSVAGGTANVWLDGTEGNWFGGKTFTNAEVSIFVTALTTGTEIAFYNTSQNIAGKFFLTDNARIVERSPNPGAGIAGGRMIVANVNASFKDGINDNANEIVYGSANASIGEWFMYGSANISLRENLVGELEINRILTTQQYPWIVSESPEYANWSSYNGIVSTGITWGRRFGVKNIQGGQANFSGNNQVVFRLPISSVAGGTANVYLDGNNGDWFGGKTFSNAEVNVFVSAMTTGTEIIFYDTNQNFTSTFSLGANARIETWPITGEPMIIASVTKNFRDGINDNANEIVYGGANASIGEWFMYGSANILLKSNILTTLNGLPNTPAQEYAWGLAKHPDKFSDYIDPLDRGADEYKYRHSFQGVYTGNIKGSVHLIQPHPTLPNLYISTGPGGASGGRTGDIIWGRSAVFNSTGTPRSDMSANNQIIIGLPMTAYESHAYGGANIFLNGTDGRFYSGQFFSNSEVNVFVSAMVTGTRIIFHSDTNYVVDSRSLNPPVATLTLTDNARIVERSPDPSRGIYGARMIVANVNTSFKDAISDNAGEIVDAGANASIGEWFMYGSANILLKSNILLTYATS